MFKVFFYLLFSCIILVHSKPRTSSWCKEVLENKHYHSPIDIDFCSNKTDGFEGDIKLTGYQADLIRNLTKKQSEHSIEKRGASKGLLLWNNIPLGDKFIIPYIISPQLGSAARNIISQAIEFFDESTCISLKPRTSEESYIEFIKESGCWSYVGRIPQFKPQQISLGSGCEWKGTAIHEIMHALGFWHEQSRPDRDEYVKILTDNIEEGFESAFNKYDQTKVDSLNSPYDLKSVMHYSSYAFTKNGKPTIVDMNDGIIKDMDDASQEDIFQINKMYNCPTASTTTEATTTKATTTEATTTKATTTEATTTKATTTEATTTKATTTEATTTEATTTEATTTEATTTEATTTEATTTEATTTEATTTEATTTEATTTEATTTEATTTEATTTEATTTEATTTEATTTEATTTEATTTKATTTEATTTEATTTEATTTEESDECLNPPNVTGDGKILEDYSIYYEGEIVTLKCAEGSVSQGPSTSTCYGSGFIPSTLTCVEATCATKPEVSGNGILNKNKKDYFAEGEKVKLRCRSGWKPENQTISVCTENGFLPSTLKCVEDDCIDTRSRCPHWASLGYCENRKFYQKACRKSCGLCTEKCRDLNKYNCAYWFQRGFCEESKYEAFMTKNCRKTCNACDKCEDYSKSCPRWKINGHCSDKYASTLEFLCQKSCDTC